MKHHLYELFIGIVLFTAIVVDTVTTFGLVGEILQVCSYGWLFWELVITALRSPDQTVLWDEPIEA